MIHADLRQKLEESSKKRVSNGHFFKVDARWNLLFIAIFKKYILDTIFPHIRPAGIIFVFAF